jgi:hypothetical protein
MILEKNECTGREIMAESSERKQKKIGEDRAQQNLLAALCPSLLPEIFESADTSQGKRFSNR